MLCNLPYAQGDIYGRAACGIECVFPVSGDLLWANRVQFVTSLGLRCHIPGSGLQWLLSLAAFVVCLAYAYAICLNGCFMQPCSAGVAYAMWTFMAASFCCFVLYICFYSTGTRVDRRLMANVPARTCMRIQHATAHEGCEQRLHTLTRGPRDPTSRTRQAGPPTTLAPATRTNLRMDFSTRSTSVEEASQQAPLRIGTCRG